MTDPRWQTVREALTNARDTDRDGWYETYEEALVALASLEAERSAGLAFERYRAEKAEAEVERLQGRLKASGVIALMRRAEEAEAEVERLREALGDGIDFATDTDDPVLLAWAERVRAALGGEGDQ